MKKVLSVFLLLLLAFVFLYALAETIPYTKVVISSKAVSISPGESRQITIKSFSPSTANSGSWVSEDTKVVTVSKTGLVKANSRVTETTKVNVNFVSGGKTLATCKVTVRVREVTSVSLGVKRVEIHPTNSYTLEAKARPNSATYPELTYSSDNISVAKVDQNGVITAVGYGTCRVTAAASNGRSAYCTVTVKDIPVKTVKLQKKTITLSLNREETLKCNVYPKNAGNSKLRWSSSDTSVAMVSESGVVTGLQEGDAVITAAATDGSGKSATCKVKVRVRKVRSFTLEDEEAEYIDIGTPVAIEYTVLPTDASYGTPVWESSDTSILTVDEKGVVTGKKSGIATVTGSVENGSMTVSKTFYVRKKNAVSVTISFGGDTEPGGDPRKHCATHGKIKRFEACLAENNGDLSFMLRNIKDIFEKDDLTVLNLECAMTEEDGYSNSAEFVLRGKPEYCAALSLGGVDAVNIRNNMTCCCGKKGYEDTKRSVETYTNGKVKWFDSENPAIVTRKGVRIGMIGFWQGKDSDEEEIQAIRALRQQCDVLIVFAHWACVTGTVVPTRHMKENARAFVENGADIVVGSGPHYISGIEKTNGKYIVYGLGNLCTGGNADKDTFIYQQTFVVHDGFVEDTNQNIICLETTDKRYKYNAWEPILARKESTRTRILKRIASYSKATGRSGYEK